MEGFGIEVAHSEGPSPGVGSQPRHFHPLQSVRVDESKAGQGQYEQLLPPPNAYDEVGGTLARGGGWNDSEGTERLVCLSCNDRP